MKNLVNSVSLATRRRNESEDKHRAAYRSVLNDALSPRVYEWRKLDDETKRELTFHRLHFEGLDVIDSDIYSFQSALADLFSRSAAISDTEAAAALNKLKAIVFAQMESLVDRENEPLYLTGEA